METIEWAFLKSPTYSRLYRLPGVMARLTEVMSAKAEPSRCLTTVSALIHDMLGSMFLAICFPSALSYRKALTAHESLGLFLMFLNFNFLFLLFLSILLCKLSLTIPLAAIVR